jgi:hypothetical protein
MNEIKFSHKYLKFPKDFNFGNAYKLIHVFVEDSYNLKKDFIEYDTFYAEGEEVKSYKLPVGKVLVLLFDAHEFGCFTTIRRLTPEKEKYYKGAVGSFFLFKLVEE